MITFISIMNLVIKILETKIIAIKNHLYIATHLFINLNIILIL